MKVTAILSDDLIQRVKQATGGKNITESLKIALESYLKSQKINQVLDEIGKEPFTFQEEFTAFGIRKINRQR